MVIETESVHQRFLAVLRESLHDDFVVQPAVHGYREPALDMELVQVFDTTIGIVETSNPQPLYDHEGIVSVEPDQRASVQSCQRQSQWHLWRLQYQKFPPYPNDVFSYDAKLTGEGVHMYVVDTYTEVDHPEFGGRLKQGPAFAEGQHTHGTHVAGLMMGDTVGFARQATGTAVQVLSGQGWGDYSQIIRALGWISDDVRKNKRRKAVVNMSLGGGFSMALNRAVEALDRQGIHVFVAAGNNAQDACNSSPSSARVSVIGATDVKDQFTSFSNHGRCVTLLAPGQAIYSSIPGKKYSWMSGTSMASPIAAGLAASYLSGQGSASPVQVREWMRSVAAQGVIQRVPRQTVNALIHHPFRGKC